MIRYVAASGVVVLTVLYALVYLLGCGPSAEAVYAAALLRCVDRSDSIAESKACRSRVNARYGVDGGAR